MDGPLGGDLDGPLTGIWFARGIGGNKNSRGPIEAPTEGFQRLPEKQEILKAGGSLLLQFPVREAAPLVFSYSGSRASCVFLFEEPRLLCFPI